MLVSVSAMLGAGLLAPPAPAAPQDRPAPPAPEGVLVDSIPLIPPPAGAPGPAAVESPHLPPSPDPQPAGPQTPGAPQAAPAPQATDPASAPQPAPKTARLTGKAFDTCTAPSLEALRAWWGSSPYRAVGIYTSGVNRGCEQPLLTAEWVREASRIGWKLMPIHVGSQARCTLVTAKQRRIPEDLSQAATRGRAEAREAVRDAERLGILPGSPIHLDMEAYRMDDADCRAGVAAFSSAWNREVRASGYLAGFYSSAESGVRDLVDARRAGRAGPDDLPDVLWYARWNGRATTTGEPRVPDEYWKGARMHQYRGEVTERHGGVALTIDRNAVDAPVAVTAAPPARPADPAAL